METLCALGEHFLTIWGTSVFSEDALALGNDSSGFLMLTDLDLELSSLLLAVPIDTGDFSLIGGQF